MGNLRSEMSGSSWKAFPALMLTCSLLAQSTDVVRTVGREVYAGACDGSAGVAWGRDALVVASDEDSTLRVYGRDQAGQPRAQVKLDAFLKGSDEADLEGGTVLGDHQFWIGSHSTKDNPRVPAKRIPGDTRGCFRELEPDRQVLFAMKVSGKKSAPKMIGQVYRNLLADLQADARWKPYITEEAIHSRPACGGLNIEALGADPVKKVLLVGFRGPVIPRNGQRLALLLPILNPAAVWKGGRLQLGDPVLLSLNGRGIRSIEYWPERRCFLLIAGEAGSAGSFQLFQWNGPGSTPVMLADLSRIQREQGLPVEAAPEGLVVYPDRKEVQLLFDEGDRPVEGQPCKHWQTGPGHPGVHFTAVWLSIGRN